MPRDLRALLIDVAAEARRLPPSGTVSLTGLQRIISALPVAALIADNDGRYVLANAAACSLTGHTTDALKRLSVWDLTPDPRAHEAERLWRTFLDRREQSGEYALLTKDGEVVTVRYAAQINLLPGLHISLIERRRRLRTTRP